MSILEVAAARSFMKAIEKLNKEVQSLNTRIPWLEQLMDAGLINVYEAQSAVQSTSYEIYLRPNKPETWKKIHKVFGRLVFNFTCDANPSANTVKVFLRPENELLKWVNIVYVRPLTEADKCRYEEQIIPAEPEKVVKVLVCSH